MIETDAEAPQFPGWRYQPEQERDVHRRDQYLMQIPHPSGKRELQYELWVYLWRISGRWRAEIATHNWCQVRRVGGYEGFDDAAECIINTEARYIELFEGWIGEALDEQRERWIALDALSDRKEATRGELQSARYWHRKAARRVEELSEMLRRFYDLRKER